MPCKMKDPQAELKQFVSKHSTQQAAAQALGIAPSHLTDLLRGRRTFSEAMLAKLGLRRAVVRA